MDDFVVQAKDRLHLVTNGPVKLFVLAEHMAEPSLLFASSGASRARLVMPNFPGDAVVSFAHDDNTEVTVRHLAHHAGERPDPTPLEIPLHFDREETYEDMVRRVIRNELSRAASDKAGTFEEEDDFEIDDDFEPWDVPTRYELTDEVLQEAPQEKLENDNEPRNDSTAPSAPDDSGDKPAPDAG